MVLVVHQGYINHVGLVLDASGSMQGLTSQTIKVADMQMVELAQQSRETDQETRASVYTFNTRVDCVFYDKDVLRLPSIKDHYRPAGQTALVDAIMQSIKDLKQTATLYGDHAFLLYVLTDGLENASRTSSYELTRTIKGLPDNWTLAVFVPNQTGVHEAKKLGFAPGNISVWDTSARGIAEVGETIRKTTTSYMTMRSQGVRSTTGLFQLDVQNLTPDAVRGTLLEVPGGAYVIYATIHEDRIDEFVSRHTGKPYKKGQAFYELVKSEKVQPQKQIMVQDLKTGKVYSGHSARQLLGLPDYEVRVDKASHPQYDIYIQSTSYNRKLVPGQQVLIVK